MSTKWWTENSSKSQLKDRHGQASPPVQRRKWLKGAMAFMLCVSLITTSGCALLPAEEEEEQLPAITPPQISQKPEYEVTTATLETRVPGNGKLISQKEETLFFTLEGKRLKSFEVELGQQVSAGQLIGELDVDDMQKDLRMQKLQYRTSEIQMKETLRKRDEMDPVELEQAMISFEEGRQKIADLEAEIAKARLVAPFSGTIVSLTVKKGDQIKAYDPVVILADTNQLLVAATISKDRIAQVAVGMPVVAEISNAGRFNGKVKHLPLATDDADNGGGQNPGEGGNPGDSPENYLIVELDEMPEGLNRGTPLSINIITKKKENAVVIPLAALRTIGSRTYVQVVDENGKKEVDVGIGQQTSTQVEILEGLTPGQKVVGR
ncbi:efflux RND transporter periplasmic adaptor subunit [Paenibacillus abyssi]|uniref:MexH family multidrug efflux RND transporter periplasmic adaptor subunit n=1 Tax=Paenibacillus abyssi TaxID=1340531 RepID=A0A917D3W1_9BACL|nr:HlyD family efflux transporter periplasmic adaptor subunit [Paenibacillus abyssi]GGG09965.1 MexH family multidrug efflux RND transporter periplasmic adaptor subunit [Paenibacillus abyssi]